MRRSGSAADPPWAFAVPWSIAVTAHLELLTGRLNPVGEEKASTFRSWIAISSLVLVKRVVSSMKPKAANWWIS